MFVDNRAGRWVETLKKVKEEDMQCLGESGARGGRGGAGHGTDGMLFRTVASIRN